MTGHRRRAAASSHSVVENGRETAEVPTRFESAVFDPERAGSRVSMDVGTKAEGVPTLQSGIRDPKLVSATTPHQSVAVVGGLEEQLSLPL